MYNECLKKKFIEEFANKESRKQVAAIIFAATAPYEEKWGIDICQASREQVQSIINEMTGIRVQGIALRIGILRRYTEWCIANNVEGVTKSIFEIKGSATDKIRSRMVANPKHLQRVLDCICDKESLETTDNMCRCYLWLAFSGVPESEAIKLRTHNIDWEGQVIRVNGKEYPIYRESVMSLRMCAKLDEFYKEYPNRPTGMYMKRYEGDYLFRTTRSEVALSESMRSNVSRRCTESRYRSELPKDDTSVDVKVCYDRIFFSGLFYRKYELEMAGVKPNFKSETLAWVMESTGLAEDEVREKYAARLRDTERWYRIDYKRWKEAFSLN